MKTKEITKRRIVKQERMEASEASRPASLPFCIFGFCALPFIWVDICTLNIKHRPNDRKIPTQHIATLLGATCRMRLATALQCWVLLAQVYKWSNLSQQQPTCRKMPKNMLRPTMLPCVALACCDSLAGAKSRIVTYPF